MKHSSDFTHFLYHVAAKALFVGLLYAVIFLMLKLARRWAKGTARKLPMIAGLNRQQRLQARAFGRGKRRY